MGDVYDFTLWLAEAVSVAILVEEVAIEMTKLTATKMVLQIRYFLILSMCCVSVLNEWEDNAFYVWLFSLECYDHCPLSVTSLNTTYY